jgi:hypothetical protein
MDMETFIKNNEQVFIDSYLESNPHMAYRINDGDLDHFYDTLDYEYVSAVMCDLYYNWINNNVIQPISVI